MTCCYFCQKEITSSEYGRQDSCKSCNRDTRVCRNCIYYDERHHNLCREPQADRVLEKERSNFCDYFSPGHPQGSQNITQNTLRNAAEALFKKK